MKKLEGKVAGEQESMMVSQTFPGHTSQPDDIASQVSKWITRETLCLTGGLHKLTAVGL